MEHSSVLREDFADVVLEIVDVASDKALCKAEIFTRTSVTGSCQIPFHLQLKLRARYNKRKEDICFLLHIGDVPTSDFSILRAIVSPNLKDNKENYYILSKMSVPQYCMKDELDRIIDRIPIQLIAEMKFYYEFPTMQIINEKIRIFNQFRGHEICSYFKEGTTVLMAEWPKFGLGGTVHCTAGIKVGQFIIGHSAGYLMNTKTLQKYLVIVTHYEEADILEGNKDKKLAQLYECTFSDYIFIPKCAELIPIAPILVKPLMIVADTAKIIPSKTEVSNVKKKQSIPPRISQATSCHQCKSTRYKTQTCKKCSKRYCSRCLEIHYKNDTTIMNTSCPCCQKICSCYRCGYSVPTGKRKMKKDE